MLTSLVFHFEKRCSHNVYLSTFVISYIVLTMLEFSREMHGFCGELITPCPLYTLFILYFVFRNRRGRGIDAAAAAVVAAAAAGPRLKQMALPMARMGTRTATMTMKRPGVKIVWMRTKMMRTTVGKHLMTGGQKLCPRKHEP